MGVETRVSGILHSIERLHRGHGHEHSPAAATCSERKQIKYVPFSVDVNRFLFFRAVGLPILTSYFLCDTTNLTRLQRQLTHGGRTKLDVRTERVILILNNL